MFKSGRLTLGRTNHFTRHELALQNPARAIRPVSCAAMPEVAIEDENGSGFGRNYLLVRVVALGAPHGLRQRLYHQMTSGISLVAPLFTMKSSSSQIAVTTLNGSDNDARGYQSV